METKWPVLCSRGASLLFGLVHGGQAHGDAFVRATLEAIVAEPDEFPRDVDPRLGLYRTFHAIWSTANIEEGEEPSRSFAGSEGIAQARLSRITPLSRQALLLTSLEGFSSEDTAYLIGATPADVDSLVAEDRKSTRLNSSHGS